MYRLFIPYSLYGIGYALILEELIIVTDEQRANHTGTVIYYEEYDGRNTNRLNEICQQSTSGRLPQYKGMDMNFRTYDL